MMRRARATLFALLSLSPFAPAVADAELGGSPASMRRQHAVARQNDYTFLRTAAQVREFVREDRLEPLVTNEHLVVNRVSFPYARPAVKLFVERLAQQFHAATGERLVVTSLTRPLSRQPRNAHRLSVHPAGMAVDLRVPSGNARRWLENTLLTLESIGLLDATRERRPPHYHVAVFPEQYTQYAERLIEREASEAAGIAVADVEEEAASVDASLDPSDTSETSHSAVAPAVADIGPSPVFPLFATLSIAGVAAAGFVRRRHRRGETGASGSAGTR